MMKKFYSPRSNRVLRRLGLVVATAISMVGCASVPVPTEQMIIARNEVGNASRVGGNEYAPLQFKSAMVKMAGAEQAMSEKDYVRAQQLAEQAQVDAQLAGAMAQSAKAKQTADALQEDSRVLRQEIDRKTK